MITIFKKTACVILTLAVSVIPVISACATGDYSWAKDDIEYCRKNKIMTGDENGNLNPGGTLTRAEMAKMLVEAFDIAYDNSKSFNDIDTDDWFYDYAKALKAYMPVTKDNFKGNETVTREFAVSEPELVVSGTNSYFVDDTLDITVGYKTGSKTEDVTADAVITGYSTVMPVAASVKTFSQTAISNSAERPS